MSLPRLSNRILNNLILNHPNPRLVSCVFYKGCLFSTGKNILNSIKSRFNQTEIFIFSGTVYNQDEIKEKQSILPSTENSIKKSFEDVSTSASPHFKKFLTEQEKK